MNREEIEKVINDRIEYFINANETGFVNDKELDDMRYALNLAKSDIDTAFEKERDEYLKKSINISRKSIEIKNADDVIREIKGFTMNGKLKAEIDELHKQIQHLEALVETQKAIIDYKENQLSVLTEQLDAAHVFCEGMKEHYIKKARKWLENEYFHGKLREIDGSWFVFEDDFIKAMK